MGQKVRQKRLLYTTILSKKLTVVRKFLKVSPILVQTKLKIDLILKIIKVRYRSLDIDTYTGIDEIFQIYTYIYALDRYWYRYSANTALYVGILFFSIFRKKLRHLIDLQKSNKQFTVVHNNLKDINKNQLILSSQKFH
jgi:hypothetical protein